MHDALTQNIRAGAVPWGPDGSTPTARAHPGIGSLNATWKQGVSRRANPTQGLHRAFDRTAPPFARCAAGDRPEISTRPRPVRHWPTSRSGGELWRPRGCGRPPRASPRHCRRSEGSSCRQTRPQGSLPAPVPRAWRPTSWRPAGRRPRRWWREGSEGGHWSTRSRGSGPGPSAAPEASPARSGWKTEPGPRCRRTGCRRHRLRGPTGRSIPYDPWSRPATARPAPRPPSRKPTRCSPPSGRLCPRAGWPRGGCAFAHWCPRSRASWFVLRSPRLLVPVRGATGWVWRVETARWTVQVLRRRTEDGRRRPCASMDLGRQRWVRTKGILPGRNARVAPVQSVGRRAAGLSLRERTRQECPLRGKIPGRKRRLARKLRQPGHNGSVPQRWFWRFCVSGCDDPLVYFS